MKKILKSALLLLCSVCILTACEDDRDSNPTLQQPSEGSLVLNTPGIASTAVYDLAHSENIVLTLGSLPDYGFPAYTTYTLAVSLNADMSNAVDVVTTPYTKFEVDAASLAATLTTMQTDLGKDESAFPMTIPVYFQVRAAATQYAGGPIEGTETTSNVVKLDQVHLLYSLPPVNTPDNLYVTGNFNGWSWDTSLAMAPTYDAPNKFWRIVFIDYSGIKFNMNKSWDGGEIGFSGLNSIGGELGAEIIDGGGNIASSSPKWYLMVVTTSVAGRDIVYDAEFQKAEVWLMGPVVGNSNWSELEDGWSFTAETISSSDAQFVSPAFAATVPGGDGDGVRAYIKISGFDWWKTEFMVYNGKIEYRGTGGDQNADDSFGYRVAGAAGQKLYLNFGNDTGEIK